MLIRRPPVLATAPVNGIRQRRPSHIQERLSGSDYPDPRWTRCNRSFDAGPGVQESIYCGGLNVAAAMGNSAPIVNFGSLQKSEMHCLKVLKIVPVIRHSINPGGII